MPSPLTAAEVRAYYCPECRAEEGTYCHRWTPEGRWSGLNDRLSVHVQRRRAAEQDRLR